VWCVAHVLFVCGICACGSSARETDRLCCALQCVAVCGSSVLQCVAVCCIMMQCVAVSSARVCSARSIRVLSSCVFSVRLKRLLFSPRDIWPLAGNIWPFCGKYRTLFAR